MDIFEKVSEVLVEMKASSLPLPSKWIEVLEELVFDVFDQDPPDMTDVEADADTLRSAGCGTDEDYGLFQDTD
jgi:hypothetical protein